MSSTLTEDPNDPNDESTITTVSSGLEYSLCFLANGDEEQNGSSDGTSTSAASGTTPAKELPPYAAPPPAVHRRPLPAVPTHIRREYQIERTDIGLRLPLRPHDRERDPLKWEIRGHCDACGDTGIMGDLSRRYVDGHTRYTDMMPVWEEWNHRGAAESKDSEKESSDDF